ncbi:transmembrane protein 72 isoform X2 [Cynoglossus semilaevis]|uniref:transmembrane protein 72 isoform X2 n=1 Tax=Cynoglossus semilaevis TaxID=244447 RepID=UPI000D631360|nr:transmembrane protein 72 isoform X2 [Cynoglossus semilaevis]
MSSHSVVSGTIMMFEMAYFLDALLFMCLLSPPGGQLCLLWGKMAHIGGFHKFLYYSIMSVVCFLHPVLVWHAVIPGTMLLVTALLNFILSKKTKNKSHKKDQSLTSVCVSASTGPDRTISLSHMLAGKRGGQLDLTATHCRPGLEEGGESVQAMLELEQRAASTDTDRKRRWKDRRLRIFKGKEEPVEREMEEMDGCCEPEPDTTSDTAPMITD